MTSHSTRKGLTALGILGLIVLAAPATLFLLPAFTSRHTHCGSSQLKDATQVRGIQQAMIAWAQSHPSPCEASAPIPR